MAFIKKPVHCENTSVRFYISYDKSYCFKSVIYPASSLLSANFESTENDVLVHANFRKIAIFKFITVITYGENTAYPC